MKRILTFMILVILMVGPAVACPPNPITCLTYRTFSGETMLAPSGDTSGATDVAAINSAIGQNKPNATQSVVRLGVGVFYINSTQILDWPFTTIEGHYLSAADGGTGTPGGTILKAAGSWSPTYSPTGPAILSTADRDTIRNLTFVGIGGATPDCVKIIDTESNDLDKVDVVGCNIGYNTMADNTLSTCGGPNFYPHQNCNTQLTHLFLGNSINNTSWGGAFGGIGGSNPAYASDSFITGTNFYANGAGGAASPNTQNGAGGMTFNFGEYARNGGPGIWNRGNYWTIVGNQVEDNSTVQVFQDLTFNFNPTAGNQIGNSNGTGPMIHISRNNYGTLQTAGNSFYGGGCIYQVDAPLSNVPTATGNNIMGWAFYEAPNTAFGCNAQSTTNLDSVIVVPGSAFP